MQHIFCCRLSAVSHWLARMRHLRANAIRPYCILLTVYCLLCTLHLASAQTKSSIRTDSVYAISTTSPATKKGIVLSDTLILLNFDGTKSAGLSTDNLLTVNPAGYVRQLPFSSLKDSLVTYNNTASSGKAARMAGGNAWTVAVAPGVCNCGAYVAAGVWKRFMCFNLGVGLEQSMYGDPFSYDNGNNNGDLYQWGRSKDGHQVRTSPITGGPLGAATAGTFMINTTPGDWLTSPNDKLWNSGTNTVGTGVVKTSADPCPPGWRVPTQAEWAGVTNTALNPRSAWNYGYSFGPSLFLPAGGTRYGTDGTIGTINNVGVNGFYWSSSSSSSSAYYLVFVNGSAPNPSTTNIRSSGYGVRCISEK